MYYLVIFLFCNHLAEDERAGGFTLIMFLLFSNHLCSASLPRGAVGWSVVCGLVCGISWV